MSLTVTDLAKLPVAVLALSVAAKVKVIVSLPSVVTSLSNVNETSPVLELIVILPVNDPLLKSLELIPETVYPTVVPSITFDVDTVKVTDDPSLIELAEDVNES